MNCPCEMIQDLLPLYLDGVCSEESKKAIEQHLAECSVCKAFYTAMEETEETQIQAHNPDRERQKAVSFHAVKKRIFRKQLLTAVAAVLILMAIAFAAVGILKNTTRIVAYEGNISVSMVDDNLVGRLQGSRENYVKIKRITGMVKGQEKNYLFFYVSDTAWDAITTDSEVFSEYTLCPADKGAGQIDAVYYFTGDYTGMETMTGEELQGLIDTSTLLWTK